MVRVDAKTNGFTESYNLYFPLIYSVIYGKLRNSDAAEDVCQEVFIRFLENFEIVENQRAWLYGTMRNVISEYVRKNKDIHVEIESLFEDISMSFVNGFKDSRLMIEEALDDENNFGDEKGRVLFDLIALHNYSYKEAGESVGLSQRQARYRYSIITDKLMEYFRKRGIKGLEDLL